MAYSVYGDNLRCVVEEMRDFIVEKVPCEWLAHHVDGGDFSKDRCRDNIDGMLGAAERQDGSVEPADRSVGIDVCREVEDEGSRLWRMPSVKLGADTFEKGEPVYTSDGTYFISERDWRAFWSDHPWWHEYVYLLDWNDVDEKFTDEVVGRMTVEEIVKASAEIDKRCIYRIAA